MESDNELYLINSSTILKIILLENNKVIKHIFIKKKYFYLLKNLPIIFKINLFQILVNNNFK